MFLTVPLQILKATSVFGAQLDSLSDFMCFGITPGFILYIYNYKMQDVFGWLSVIFYILCIVIRLARFNSDLIKSDKTDLLNNEKNNQKQKSFFKGVPAPASALLVLLPIILANVDGFDLKFSPLVMKFFMPIYTILIGFLAVSKIPTFSIKNLKVNKKYFSFIVLSLGSLIILLITYPWKIIPIIVFLYLFFIVFSIINFNKLNK